MAASRFPSWLLAVVFCKVLLYGTVLSAEDNLLSGRSDQHLKKQICVSAFCKGLFDRDLKLCYKIFCSRETQEDEDYAGCVLDNCSHHIGFLRKVCVHDKCRKYNDGGGSSGKSKGGDNEENGRLDRLMGEVWSGELAVPQGDIDGDLGDLLYGPRPVEMPKSCTTKCKEKALNGEDDFEACFLANCKGVSSSTVNVGKRWSTRMCMESHCKSANNKVQYFLCGKQHCHK